MRHRVHLAREGADLVALRDVDVMAELGEKTAWGMSEVYLPSQNGGAVVLPVPVTPKWAPTTSTMKP